MPDSQNTKQNGSVRGEAAARMTDAERGYLARIIAEMRARLLDLTRRNRLISTPLQGRRNAYLRVIAAQPDALFRGLREDKVYRLASLPALSEDPKDEETAKFRTAFAHAERTDEEYRVKRNAILQDDDDREKKRRAIKRELKDNVRAQLSMNPRPKGNDHPSLAEHARQNGIAPSHRLDWMPAKDAQRDDNKIQTRLLPEDLKKLADMIYRAGKDAEEETGVNILQGAFGFLEWSDDPGMRGRGKVFSPLITMPIRIERTSTKRGVKYSIRRSDGAVARNRALFEKLKKDHEITTLPEFDEEQDSIRGYFETLQEAGFLNEIHGELRCFIAFGRFPSARLAMYEDLAEPKPAFLAGLIRTFFRDAPPDGNPGDPAEEYDVDAPDIEGKVPRIVMDADSSQFSALVDIADGKNLAVEGPPGTGKSQTIVNAIAAAMVAGNTVLFVAEKRAALDVVYARLDALGLGEFAWLLTATRAQRREVIESIRERLEIETTEVTLDRRIARREQKRDALKSYIDIVSSQFEKSGMTVHRILGARIKHYGDIAKLPDVVEPNDDLLDVLDEYLQETIHEFDMAQVAAGNAQPHWRSLAVVVHPSDVRAVLAHCEKIARGLRKLQNLDTGQSVRDFRWWNVFLLPWWRFLARDLIAHWKQAIIQVRLWVEKFQLALLVGKETLLPKLWEDIYVAAREFRNMANDRAGLRAHSAYRSRLKEIARCQPLFALHEIIENNNLGAGRLEEIVHLVRIETWANKVMEQHDAQLRDEFSGRCLSALRAEFAKLDKEIIAMSSQELRHQLCARAHPGNLPAGRRGPRVSDQTERALIEHQIGLTRGFKSPRYLAKKAGRSLSMLKPCWMMSPLAVAQYVDKDQLQFDLCIIDEASQMLTENAVGALMRAKQVVVVGDEKQLPPTRFFQHGLVENDEAMVAPDESILRRANAVLHPRRQLKWHYRSRDSRLINFSNRHFYSDGLIVFPAANEERADMGVSLIEIKDSSYKSGGNAAEADVMKNAILDFMARHPGRSLGVVTMNRRQTDLLDSEIQFALANHEAARRYVENWDAAKEGIEKFFIKNIENVQGDERDVIFIGTVYGPEQPGGGVMQRFGPINHAGGERRLNVLFSRAKERIVTFSAMHANDIHGNTPGARILRKWLEYAATGRLDRGDNAGGEPGSPFEEHVIEKIRRRYGQEAAVPQVGVRGYFIDIGIKHPEWPHGYLLGVECDGASYHSSKSARERDRLRQEVLEGLGWQLHRIWSTDWFYDPENEMQQLEETIQSCLRRRRAEQRAKQQAEQPAEPCEPACTALVPQPLLLDAPKPALPPRLAPPHDDLPPDNEK